MLSAANGPTRHPPIPVDVMRGPVMEARHVVYGVVLGTKGGDAEAALTGVSGEGWGDAAHLTLARSSIKPWQALPFVVDGAAEHYGVDDRELALACGSHAGQKEHVDVLEGLMQKCGVTLDMLRCPGHAPFDEKSARLLKGDWDKRHDNCSGKHTAMVGWSRHAGHDPTGYTKMEHPAQKRILDLLLPLAGVQQANAGMAIDGCTAPNVAMRLADLARLFLLLGDPGLITSSRLADALGQEAQPVQQGLTRLAQAMADHPQMVAGDARIDTELGLATGGRIVSKAGAEGLWCGVDRERGVAFAFKTVDGGFRAVVPAGLAVLREQGLLSDKEQEPLLKHLEPVLRDRAGGKVGRIVVRAP